jgi:hypothetical protein
MSYRGGYFTEDFESVYKIIPPKVVHQEKPPKYRSKHHPSKPATASTFHQMNTTHPLVSNLAGDFAGKVVADKDVRTMGKAPGSNASTPRDYIRKASHNCAVATLAEVKHKSPESLQPTSLKPRMKGNVPSRSEPPVMSLVTTKNFIVANAVEAILAAPKKVAQPRKDYIKKEDYGTVPKYLAHVKDDVQAEYDYIQMLEEERAAMTRSAVRPMEDDERQALISGLKEKWDKVNIEYQATTHLTKLDTAGKIRRKEHYETTLAQIEKDLEKLNRKNIVINGDY